MEEGPGFAVGVVEAGAGVALTAEEEAGAVAGGEEGMMYQVSSGMM